MTKALLILSLLVFVSSTLFSQNGKAKGKKFDASTIHYRKIEIPEIISDNQSAVKKITVIDVRWDTTALGFSYGMYLTLAKPLNECLRFFLEDSLTNDNKPGNYVVFLKNFWYSEQVKIDSRRDYQSNNPQRTIGGTWLPGILLDVQCYFQRDEKYYPLFAINTKVVAEDYRQSASDIIKKAFGMIENRIANSDVNACISKENYLTWNELDKAFQERFNIPIVTDTLLKKGVYLSFDEFKLNNPTVQEFKVDFDKNADKLYIKNVDGEMRLTTVYWGFCDGNNIYIKKVDNLFPLTKVKRSFYLMGAKSKTVYMKNGAEMMGTLATLGTANTAYPSVVTFNSKKGYKITYNPYRIDLDLGDIY